MGVEVVSLTAIDLTAPTVGQFMRENLRAFCSETVLFFRTKSPQCLPLLRFGEFGEKQNPKRASHKVQSRNLSDPLSVAFYISFLPIMCFRRAHPAPVRRCGESGRSGVGAARLAARAPGSDYAAASAPGTPASSVRRAHPAPVRRCGESGRSGVGAARLAARAPGSDYAAASAPGTPASSVRLFHVSWYLVAILLAAMLSNCTNEDADILFLQETFLSTGFPDSLITGSTEYQLFRQDRQNRTGGGVALIIHKLLKPVPITINSPLEVIAADINSPHFNYRLISAYRPPNSGIEYMNSLSRLILSLDSPKHITILAGDFNLPQLYTTKGHIPTNNTLCQTFDDLTDSLDLAQLNKNPSRPSTDNVLDLVFCPTIHTTHLSDLSLCEEFHKSDHFGLKFSLTFSDKPRESLNSYRNFRKGNYDKIKTFLEQVNWNDLFHSSGHVNSYMEKFVSILHYAISLYIPISKTHKTSKLPSAVIRLRNKKRASFKNRITNPDKYKHCSNLYTQALKNHTKQVEKGLIEQGKIKELYKHVKNKTSDKSTDFPISVNGDQITDATAIANHFSDFFASVYTSSNGIIPPSQNRTREQFSQMRFTTHDIIKTLKEMKPKLSFGPDEIPMFFLKQLSTTIASPLSILFNWSFNSALCPSLFLKTRVIPVFKRKGSRSDIQNYRPISIGSAIAKLMEKMVTNRLLSFLTKNDLISTYQHGFLPKRSTCTQLASCINDWTTLKATKTPCYVIYLDFKKAFDSVDHSKLISKLTSHGITGLLSSWIHSYLSHRVQRVAVKDSLSRYKPVDSGILQGSCIGPLLFVTYINDLLDTLSKQGIKVAAYADDIKLYGPDPNLLQLALNYVTQWCETWQLKLSPDKCCSISLSNGPDHQFNIQGVPLTCSDSIVDLGVTIDNSLDFTSHILAMVKKAKQTSWITLKCFTSGYRVNLLRAYTTYVRPKLEYCPQIWNPQSRSDILLIERVQKHFTKQIFYRCGYKKQPYEIRLQRLNLDSLESRRLRLDLCFAHKTYHNLLHCPDVLQIKDISRTLVHNHRLENQICVPKFRGNFFSNRIVKFWNKFTDEQIELDANSFHNLLFPPRPIK